MTFKEKLQKEHPDCIHKRYCGGASGCPSDYNYENDGLCVGRLGPSREKCTKCWDREIIEENENENETKNLSETTRTEMFICEKCGVHLQDFFEQKYGKNENYTYYETFECSYCPKCGRKVIE